MTKIFPESRLTTHFVLNPSYDLLLRFSKGDKVIQNSIPNTFLFKIDDKYLKSEGLQDNDGTYNFGYVLSNKHIVNFIKKLDLRINSLEKKHIPKALFIDFDFSFNTNMTDDKKLIEILAQDRPYIILLPKTSKYNIIEQSTNIRLQEKIKKGRILFTAVSLASDEDHTTRKYEAISNYKPYDFNKKSFDEKNKAYIYTPLVLWYLSKYNKVPTLEEIHEEFENNTINKNIILFKERILNEEGKGIESLNKYDKYLTNWEKYTTPICQDNNL